jgi:acetylornithine deacetylase/succinyl-diaminopimelate desuccinylase-like protein
MEVERLFQELLSFRSVSYNEKALAEWLVSYLQDKELDPELDYFDPGSYLDEYAEEETANVYLDLGEGEHPLLLYSHLDVVGADEAMFEPVEKDGEIHARGAADMKAALAALAKFAESYSGNQRVLIHFIADEETSGTGARAAIRNLRGREFKSLDCVLMEPTDNFDFVEKEGKGYGFYRFKGEFKNLWRIANRLQSFQPEGEHAELGKNLVTPTKIELKDVENSYRTVKGEAAHGSTPEEGINSLSKLINSDKNVKKAWTPQNSRNTLPQKTCYVEGEPSSTEGTLYVDVRTIFGHHEEIINKIDEITKETKVYLDDVGQPYSTPRNSKVMQACRKAVDDIELKSSKGGSDAGYYSKIAQNVIGGFGPGTRDVIHTDEEYIDKDQLKRTVKIIEKTVENYSQLR